MADNFDKKEGKKQDLDQIKSLLKENLALTKELKKMVKDVKKFVFWSRVFTVLKISLLVVPIVLGFIYLPPLIEKYVDQVKNYFGISIGGNSSSLNLDDIPPELIEKYSR